MEFASTEAVSATYHVFINHRGPDVKKSLASLIYHRLKSCGLRVFHDENELHTGDELSPAIVGAIKSASVHIAIFSKRYAESKWCLDELCWIFEKPNRNIIPVFYDVEPTDLRYIDSERGHYRIAFEEHQRKGRVAMEDIEKWKKALKKASKISGLLFKTDESDLGEVLEEIVKAVLKGVEREPFELPKYLVGLDPVVKEINDEIKKQSELNGTVIMGITGMAGVGKSTLVTYLYNLKRSDFSRSCFLSDIRKKDLPSLQQKLLRDLLNCDFRIEDTRQGKGIFRNRLRGLQVLIVLDDADHMEQISSLLVTDVVGSSSLILITSRDQDLLRRSSPKTVVYDVKPLQIKDAQQLFCRHAFDQSEPDEGFECLVEEVLKICGGLPFSLKLLGGMFHGRSEEEYWKRQLQKLCRRLPEDIRDTLKVSYEALNSEEKEIFLDLGCFLVGEDKEVAVRVLEGLGYKDVGDCLENLRQKCLLEYEDDLQSGDEITEDLIDVWHDPNGYYDYLYLPKREKITMHAHIGQLARGISREKFGVLPAGQPLRLSCSDDIEELMSKLQGGADFCLIRGIRTPQGQNLPDCTSYIKGVGVRLLVVEVPIDLSSPFGVWDMSGDLVWLRLRSLGSIYFPDTFSLRNIRVLELEGHGDLEQFFQRFNMPPLHLSVLNIDMKGTHRMTPRQEKVDLEANAYSGRLDLNDSEVISVRAQQRFKAPYFFRFLEWIGTSIKIPGKIVLKNITFLESLPIGFGELKRLRHLDLSGCTNLTQLPESFSELMHLQFLVLRDCINLSIPLDILGNMSSLEYADFNGCRKLKYLPTGMANQMSLTYLNLLHTDLKWPLNVKLPEKLQRLRIGNSQKRVLPAPPYFHPERKPAAEKKEEKKSGAIAYVHPEIKPADKKKEEKKAEPSAYFHPEKKPVEEGTKLWQSLGDLRRLKELKELILIDFYAVNAILWEEIAGPNMKVLVIRDCPIDTLSFKEQGSYMHVAMSALIDFTLMNTCISEICIPEGVLPSLETLDLSHNWKLMQVSHLPSTLIRLNLKSCERLKALTNLSNLVNLKFLCINHCYNLETLNVEGLTSLEEIQAVACTKLKTLINLSNLVNLKFLCIKHCYNLETLNVEGLTSLEEIQAEACTKLKTLINLSNLVHLKSLRINGCKELETLNVEGLTSLEEIQAQACRKLESIQGLSHLEGLKYLGISTDTNVMWNSICNFLTSTCHENLSTAAFTGRSTITYYDTDMVVRQSITEKFKVKVVDVVFPATPSAFNEGSFEFHAKIEDFQMYGGILMCFLTISRGRDVFGVRFESGNDGTSADEYTIICGEDVRYEQKLHVFMWTEECGLFTHHKGYDNIGIYSETMPLSKGWIIMVDKNRDVSQICKQIIIALSLG